MGALLRLGDPDFNRQLCSAYLFQVFDTDNWARTHSYYLFWKKFSMVHQHVQLLEHDYVEKTWYVDVAQSGIWTGTIASGGPLSYTLDHQVN